MVLVDMVLQTLLTLACDTAEDAGQCPDASLFIRASVRLYQHVQGGLLSAGLLMATHMSP